jgi:DNA repair ATPase RecN
METIAANLKRKPDAIYVKCLRLGLTQKRHSASINVPLPKELPSVEEAIKKLAAALETASTPGLDRVEVQRLQVVANLAKAYEETLAHYLNYREIEAKLNDMEAKYEGLLRETKKNNVPEPVSTQMAETTGNQPTDLQSQP